MDRLVTWHDADAVRTSGDGTPAGLAPTRGWRSTIGLLRLGCLLLPLLILAVWGVHSWRAEHDRALKEAQRSVELVREYALRLVQTQESVLDHLISIMEEVERKGADGRMLQARIAALDDGFDFLLSLGVVTPKGRLVLSSRTLPLDDDVSDRSYFRALQAGSREIQFERLRLRLRRAGRDAVVIAKRRPGEAFAGAVISAVAVDAFTDFFGRIAADPGAAASLLRADGMLLVRHGPAEPPIRLPAEAPAMRAIAATESGTYRANAFADGIERLYAYSRVGELPLFVNIGVATRSILNAWLAGMVEVGGFLVIAAMLGFAAVTQAMRSLRAEEARRLAELDRSALEAMRRTAAFREMLLRELHHRVKNSLMTVQALIRLRGREAREAEPVLHEIEQRVLVLAKVHELLHVSQFASRLDLATFLRALCASPAIVPPGRAVTVSCEVEPVEVGIEQAVPAALVAIELLTNALKHAFPAGRPGRVTIALRREREEAVLAVRDDGIGLSEEPERRRLGLRLVDRFVAQLGGRLDTRRNGCTEFRVTFPVAVEPVAA